MKAALVISHGSRSPQTKKEVEALVEVLKKRSGYKIVEFAFLELEKPSIPEGIENCINAGAKEIKVLLNFLNSGTHVDKDIPEIVRQSQKKFPHVKMDISRPVGQHPRISELFLDMMP